MRVNSKRGQLFHALMLDILMLHESLEQDTYDMLC